MNYWMFFLKTFSSTLEHRIRIYDENLSDVSLVQEFLNNLNNKYIGLLP